MSATATRGVVSAFVRFTSAVAPLLARGVFGTEPFADGRDEADALAAVAALGIVARACSPSSDLDLDRDAIEARIFDEVVLPRFPAMPGSRQAIRHDSVGMFDAVMRKLAGVDLSLALIAYPYAGRLPGETALAAAKDVASALVTVAGRQPSTSVWYAQFVRELEAIAKDPYGLLQDPSG